MKVLTIEDLIEVEYEVVKGGFPTGARLEWTKRQSWGTRLHKHARVMWAG